MKNEITPPGPAFTVQELYDLTGTSDNSTVIGWLLRVTMPIWFAQRELTILLENRDKLAEKRMTPDEVATKKIEEIDTAVRLIFGDADVATSAPGLDRTRAAFSAQGAGGPSAQRIVAFFQRKDAWNQGQIPESIEDFRLALVMPGAPKARLLAELKRRVDEIRAREESRRIAALADVLAFNTTRLSAARSAMESGGMNPLLLCAVMTACRSAAKIGTRLVPLGTKVFGMDEPLCLHATADGWAIAHGCVVKG